jgi:hypothetical protein
MHVQKQNSDVHPARNVFYRVEAIQEGFMIGEGTNSNADSSRAGCKILIGDNYQIIIVCQV